MQINIPVKPHVKKFLLIRYGNNHQISKKSFIGILTLQVLEKTYIKEELCKNGKVNFSFNIAQDYFNRYGSSLTDKKRLFIGKCFELLFFEDFYNFVDVELLKGSNNAYQSVVLFLKIYNLKECDVKLESMYRNYQRYCKENIKKKKHNS